MPGPSWNQWRNQMLQITTRSFAFPSVLFDYTTSSSLITDSVAQIFHYLVIYIAHLVSFLSPHRPKNHDRETQEQILCDQEAFYCRPAAHYHQLSRVQPSRQWVLQMCQHLGEVLLLQTKRRGPDREMKSAADLFTGSLTDKEQASLLPHTVTKQVMRKLLLAIIISELIKGY